jgi:phosphatidate phosphatase APP1
LSGCGVLLNMLSRIKRRWAIFWCVAVTLVGAISTAARSTPLQVIADDGWQGEGGCVFSGRLVAALPRPDADAGGWTLISSNTRLLLSGGEEGAVSWKVGTAEWKLIAGDGGYWMLASSLPTGLSPGWYDVKTEPLASSQAGFLVPDARNTVGLISDLDDTILVTEVLHRRKMLENSLATPVERRQAVPGMAGLYHKMIAVNPAPETTPVFYVSATPRQLTDNIRGFLRVNGFPRGILMLRKVEPPAFKAPGDAYKLGQIETILAAFPAVSFILCGDDGERDPEIYAEIRRRHPTRVAAVWIRGVNPAPNRPRFEGQLDPTTMLSTDETKGR